AQIDSVIADVPQNLHKHVEFVRRARAGGADLVVFPELSLTGYSVKDSNLDVAIRSSDREALQPLIDESRDISILSGCRAESDRFGLYNAALLCESGKVRSVHRKVYPPTYGMFEESRYFASGSSVRSFDTPFA